MSTVSRFRNACLALCLATCTCAPGVAWASDASADAAGAAKASPITRLSGETSAETAQAIALATFSKADTAILATDNGFADAMSATGLAGALDAPILLTGRDELSPAARDAIERLGITNVIIVGGGAVISSDVASDVAELLGVSAKDVENNRLYGNEAEDTSVACAAELTRLNGPQDKAIVTSSVNFQDALSISSFAYKYQVPIFLESAGATSTDRALPDLAITMLTGKGYYSQSEVYVPGGPGAVSKESVENTLGSRSYTRMYGNDGYDTSNAIATYVVEKGLLVADNAVIACGAEDAKGTDAIAGAALAGKNGSVVLLTNGNAKLEDKNTVTIDDFMTNNASAVEKAYVLGGTYVFPNSLVDQICQLIA